MNSVINSIKKSLRPMHVRTLVRFGFDNITSEAVRYLMDRRTDVQIVSNLRFDVASGLGIPVEHAENALLALVLHLPEVDEFTGCVATSEPDSILSGRRGAITRRITDSLPDQLIEAADYAASIKYRVHPSLLNSVLGWSPQHLDPRMKDETDRLFETSGLSYWLPVFLDYRGRMYTHSFGLLSYQGDDISRGLCWFDMALEVTQEDIDWFVINVIKDQFGFTCDGYEECTANGGAFFHDPESFGYHGTSPVKALGAMFAWKEMVETGHSSYPVQQDASCSGFQHIACLMRNAVLASHVNLVGTDGDLYMAVADVMMNVMPWLKDYHRQAIRQQLAKPTVMVTGYGGGADGIAMDWMGISDNVKAKFITIKAMTQAMDGGEEVEYSIMPVLQDQLDGLSQVGQAWACLKMARAWQNMLFTMFPCVLEYLNLMKDTAKIVFKASASTDELRCVSWSSPFGLHVQLPLWKVDTTKKRQISCTIEGTRHQRTILGFKETNGSAAAPPCFIHTLDAALVHWMLLQCKAEGIQLACIHDSFGTHVCHARRVQQMYIEGLKWLYGAGQDRLGDFQKSWAGPMPELGDFNVDTDITGTGIGA